MDAGTLIYSLLSQSPAVVAICGGRVFPVRVPQGQLMPAVAYQLITQMPQEFIGGSRGDDTARFQLSIFSDTYPQAVALALACRKVLDGYRPAPGATVAVVLDMETDHFEDGADRFHRSQDYRLNLPSPL